MSPMQAAAKHVVRRLWVRAEPGAAPEERPRLDLEAGAGVVGDHTHGRMRHVTLVFEEDWAAACRDLGRAVDPVARRANVLLSGGGGGALIGRTVRLGGVRVEVRGETKPCPVMDAAAEGLQAALGPQVRAGVWGRVLEGGAIAPGDLLEVEGDAPHRAGA
jgi:MOSC domain-containing protein YiiM